jgi:F-box-like
VLALSRQVSQQRVSGTVYSIRAASSETMASDTKTATEDEGTLWDINYCEEDGGPVTPFRYFATPQAPGALEEPRSFPHLDLPAEILLFIFQFCNAPTLFQCMRTCRGFRYMASKRFWSDSTVWCRISREWWTSQKARLPGRLDMEFARQATQVEIDVLLHHEFAVQRLEHDDWYGLERAERVNIFWLAVQTSFPSARSVILNSPQVPNEDSEGYSAITFLLQQAPRNIHVFASGAGRVFLSIGVSTAPQLQPGPTSWFRKRVIAPTRQLRKGPLRDFELMRRIKHLAGLEERGLQRLIREAHTRYPDGKGIKCPKMSYVRR